MTSPGGSGSFPFGPLPRTKPSLTDGTFPASRHCASTGREWEDKLEETHTHTHSRVREHKSEHNMFITLKKGQHYYVAIVVDRYTIWHTTSAPAHTPHIIHISKYIVNRYVDTFDASTLALFWPELCWHVSL